MGRQSDYLERKVASSSSDSVAFAEALLGSTITKRRQQVSVQFDDLRDADAAHRYLRGLQDNYRAPRK
jgi:hypothetical protein